MMLCVLCLLNCGCSVVKICLSVCFFVCLSVCCVMMCFCDGVKCV